MGELEWREQASRVLSDLRDRYPDEDGWSEADKLLACAVEERDAAVYKLGRAENWAAHFAETNAALQANLARAREALANIASGNYPPDLSDSRSECHHGYERGEGCQLCIFEYAEEVSRFLTEGERT